MSDQPNIVLVICDQWRGDCLGISGHPVVETPHLDGIARNGVNFTSAYSAVPSCIAARAGLLTGLRPQSHGRVGYRDGVDWNYDVTMPGEFASAGYHTQAVGKMHVFPERSLMGFHNVVLHDGYLHHSRKMNSNYALTDDYWRWLKENAGADADYQSHGLQSNSWVARPWHMEEKYHPTNWVVSESINFLQRRDRRKPFFLMMSFVRPHAPLDPPACYFEQYLSQEMPPVPIGDWADTDDADRNGLYPNTVRGIIGERQLHRARAGYYGCMTHIDHQIGRFSEALGEDDPTGNTIWLFTSDHGELMGDHNLFRKAFPYEGPTRIPFFLRAPDRFGLAAGGEVDSPVELRDVMPTLLDLAGVDVPPSVEGHSVLPLARGDSPNWRSYIHGEHAWGPESNHYLTDGREKYIWYSQDGREQLFDLANDRQELHDLSQDPSRKTTLAEWRARLVAELDGREEGYVQDGALITGRTADPCLKHIR